MELDTGTVIAIVAPNVVTATAIFVGWKQYGRGLRHERALSDLDGLRALLDEAAVALHDTSYALVDAYSDLMRWGRWLFAEEERTASYRTLQARGKALDELAERLKVRLGRDHAVVEAFGNADQAALDAFRALGRIELEGGDDSPPELLTETHERLTTARANFNAARLAFLDAANKTAGAELSRHS